MTYKVTRSKVKQSFSLACNMIHLWRFIWNTAKCPVYETIHGYLYNMLVNRVTGNDPRSFKTTGLRPARAHYPGLALDLYTVLIPLSGYVIWFWITGDPFLA